jgi:ATP-dependent DNA ligase
VKRRSCERLVAKDEASPYIRAAGPRSWLKAKLRQEADFPVVGISLAGERVEALLFATREDRRLRYVGTVADILARCPPVVRPDAGLRGRAGGDVV